MGDQESKIRTGRVIDDDSQTGRTIVNLREMILRGEFRPGERLSELPLVARLGVSRTPLRLALDRLSNWGLLEEVSTGGFMIREFLLDDIWDTMKSSDLLPGVTEIRLPGERLARITLERRTGGIPIHTELRRVLDKLAGELGIQPLG